MRIFGHKNRKRFHKCQEKKEKVKGEEGIFFFRIDFHQLEFPLGMEFVLVLKGGGFRHLSACWLHMPPQVRRGSSLHSREGILIFSFPAKNRQFMEGVKRFRGGERLQGLQGFLQVFGQQGLGLLHVFAVKEVVAELEEDAEVEAEVGDVFDLLGCGLD